MIEWINLGLKDPSLLAGAEIKSGITKDVEASIYLGAAHNWTNIHSLYLKEIAPNKYEIHGKVIVEFENERIAKNEDFEFTTIAVFTGEA
jgi:hypothetical protein